MDLYEYIILIKKSWIIPVVIALVLGVWSWRDVARQPYDYTGTVTFTVGNKAVQNNQSAQYAQYYNLSSASSFADTIVNLIASPNIITDTYASANEKLPTQKLTSLAKIIRAGKSSGSSSVVIASVQAQSKESTQKIVQSLSDTIAHQVDTLQTSGAISKDLTLSASSPALFIVQKNVGIQSGLAVIAGLFIGSAFIFLRHSLKRTR